MKEMLDFFAQLEVTELPAGTKLFRGSFKGWINECFETPQLGGVKYFSRVKECARPWATKENENFVPPKSDGVVYSAELAEPCKVVIFRNQGALYRENRNRIEEKYPDVLENMTSSWYPGRFWVNNFERLYLMPLIRQAKSDNLIAGYFSGTTSDEESKNEVLLDLNLAKIVIHSVDIIPLEP